MAFFLEWGRGWGRAIGEIACELPRLIGAARADVASGRTARRVATGCRRLAADRPSCRRGRRAETSFPNQFSA